MNNYTVNVTFHSLEVGSLYCKDASEQKYSTCTMPFCRCQYYKSINGGVGLYTHCGTKQPFSTVKHHQETTSK